jgi:hypothetical protein
MSLFSARTVQPHYPWDTIPGQHELFVKKCDVKEVG